MAAVKSIREDITNNFRLAKGCKVLGIFNVKANLSIETNWGSI